MVRDAVASSPGGTTRGTTTNPRSAKAHTRSPSTMAATIVRRQPCRQPMLHVPAAATPRAWRGRREPGLLRVTGGERCAARLSQLGDRDALLAVADDERADGYSVGGESPLSDGELADLAVQEVEPRLAAGDWAGAAVAMADGLRTGGGAGDDGGGGGPPVGALLVGAGIVGGVPCCCGVDVVRAPSATVPGASLASLAGQEPRASTPRSRHGNSRARPTPPSSRSMTRCRPRSRSSVSLRLPSAMRR
jgi:hypothetical protein